MYGANTPLCRNGLSIWLKLIMKILERVSFCIVRTKLLDSNRRKHTRKVIQDLFANEYTVQPITIAFIDEQLFAFHRFIANNHS